MVEWTAPEAPTSPMADDEESALLNRGGESCAPPAPATLGASTLLWFFTAANTLIFVDRGVVSGASLQFDAFIGESLGVGAAHDPDSLADLMAKWEEYEITRSNSDVLPFARDMVQDRALCAVILRRFA